MLTALAIIALIVVAAVLGYAATRPDTFRIQRTASIQAPAEKIFALINDFRNWRVWSPWEKMDPTLKRTFEGPPNGPGARYEWEGNKKVGKGRMEIMDAPPPHRIEIKLDFLRPFEAHNIVEFTLAPQGSATNVTWAMHGPNLFVGKVMGLFFNMDRLVGKDFEAGLANLKTVAERQALAGS